MPWELHVRCVVNESGRRIVRGNVLCCTSLAVLKILRVAIEMTASLGLFSIEKAAIPIEIRSKILYEAAVGDCAVVVTAEVAEIGFSSSR